MYGTKAFFLDLFMLRVMTHDVADDGISTCVCLNGLGGWVDGWMVSKGKGPANKE